MLAKEKNNLMVELQKLCTVRSVATYRKLAHVQNIAAIDTNNPFLVDEIEYDVDFDLSSHCALREMETVMSCPHILSSTRLKLRD